MAEFQTCITASLDDLDDWPGAGNRLDAPAFLGLPWLHFYRRIMTGRPYYLVITRAGEPVAAALAGTDGYLYLPAYLQGAAQRFIQRFFTPRVLACEVPSMGRAGLWLHPAHAVAAAPVLAEALRTLAATTGRPLVIASYVDEALHRTLDAALPPNAGYGWQADEDDICLDLDVPSLDAYLARLDHDHRGHLRNLPRRAARQHLHVERLDGARCAACAPALFRLTEAVHRRHGRPGSALSPSLFADLNLLPPENFVLYAVCDEQAENRVVAHGGILMDGAEGTLYLFGLDYSASFHNLQGLLYLACITEAIDAGLRRLRLGFTHLDEKTRRLGARRAGRYSWIAGRGAYALLPRLFGFRRPTGTR